MPNTTRKRDTTCKEKIKNICGLYKRRTEASDKVYQKTEFKQWTGNKKLNVAFAAVSPEDSAT